MRNIAASARDSLQYSVQLVVIYNDNKQNILCNIFAYDQNVYYFTLRWFNFDQRFKKKVVQTNCLLCFNVKSSIEVKILFRVA